ncbi:MAG: ATP-grasp domain-containing protein [Desulfobacterota bacterium]|nr:ATP-grasp domain-containing protein [Thermodesulfobacteriota bacterium]
MAELKVAVLYNLLERLEKGEEKDFVAEAAIVEEIGAIEEGLRFNGYLSYVLAVRDEIESVIHWLQKIRPDVVFNLCESIYGDARLEMTIPALLDLLRIPYTGSSALTLGLCQDKGKVKDILTSHGILTPKYKVFDREVGVLKGHLFPMIVKPLHEDGSLGISKESVVFSDEDLNRQVRYVIERYRQPALVEEFIEGRELNVGLMESDGRVEVLPISEIDYSEFPEGIPKICSYEAKWVQESPEYQKSKPICPAALDWILQKQVEHLAVRVFKLFGCRDYARVDMRIGRDGKIYILEVNPNPDISPPSGMVRAIKAKGMTYAEFIRKVIERAHLRGAKR